MAEYNTAVIAYSEAVSALIGHLGAVQREEFQRLCELSEKAKLFSMALKERLDAHIAQHKC
jgi:hypothetical protein